MPDSTHIKRAAMRAGRSLGALMIGALAAFLVSGDFTGIIHDLFADNLAATIILMLVAPAVQGLDKLRRDVKGGSGQ